MLYAIGDLHLGIGINKTMDRFGDNWLNHKEKLQKNSLILKEEDTLLLLGDISWAMNLKEAYEDLEFIQNMKGNKYLIPGNHDYWWSSTNKLNESFDMNFIKHGCFFYNDYAICVTKGSVCPNDLEFSKQDEKIYIREYNRLRNSLEKAKNAGYSKFIVLLHYPPTNVKKDRSKYIEIVEEFNVEILLYAHIHGSDNFNSSLIGSYNNVKYDLVSSDYLDFKPKRIM